MARGKKKPAVSSPEAAGIAASIWRRHSLTIIGGGILGLWLILYGASDPRSHPGSFFGNAIADWTGVMVSVTLTKWFFEAGSKESRQPHLSGKGRLIPGAIRRHSLTIVLAATGIGWLIVFSQSDPQSKWGTVSSNMVSEWSQQIGLVLLTKKLFEAHSKESHGGNG